MADFTVHGFTGIPFGRSVLATLEEKRAPWRMEGRPSFVATTRERLIEHAEAP